MNENNDEFASQQSQPPQQGAQVPGVPQAPVASAHQSTSGVAIAGLVLGVLAILTSFLPIINNGSFFLGIVGLILAIVGLMGIRKGKHSGKGIAIAGIVLGILSIVIVLATQSLYSAAINKASDELKAGSTPVSAPAASASASAAAPAAAPEGSGGAASQAAEQQAVDYQNMALGAAVDLKSGLSVKVNSIQGGLTNYDGSEVVCVNVTYTNNGNKQESFNPYDWKAEDSSGALRTQAYYSNEENSLSSGNLSAGGTVTGNIYFDAPVTKVHYYGNMFDDASAAAWVA